MLSRRLRRAADDGAVIPLVLVYAAIVAAMTVAAIDASVAFLSWRGLNGVADAAALRAAQAVDEASLYAGGGDGILPLSQEAAERAVADYLADSPDVEWRAAVAADGRSVTVTVRRQVHLPFVRILQVVDSSYADGRVPVEATARARAPIR